MKKKTSKFKISGATSRPRVCVFRSNKEIYAQAISDIDSKTIISSSSKEINEKKSPVEMSFLVGETLAKKLIEAKITEIVYDRNKYRYHGRIKALAEGLRKGGIKF